MRGCEERVYSQRRRRFACPTHHVKDQSLYAPLRSASERATDPPSQRDGLAPVFNLDVGNLNMHQWNGRRHASGVFTSPGARHMIGGSITSETYLERVRALLPALRDRAVD